MKSAALAFLLAISALPAPVASAAEKPFTAYITGYGYHDNTPAGVAISHGVIRRAAGGTGTYDDPITLAVGHSIIDGKDILDIPAGTRFYIPNLRRYFIVEDTCGDGPNPQSIPCHIGYEGLTWLDVWVGGSWWSRWWVNACQEAITGKYLVIRNPAKGYAVVPGLIFNVGCTKQYGNAVVTRGDDAKESDVARR